MQGRWLMRSVPILCGLVLVQARAGTRPVPVVCNTRVNAELASFLQQHAGREGDQDNVLLCGSMLRDSYTQHAGHNGTGAHQVLVVNVPTARGPVLLEVVTNDALDGQVSARKGDAIFAYGQAYVDAKPIHAAGLDLAGGLHETHCSTHAGADDGWVVIAGKRYPARSCSGAR